MEQMRTCQRERLAAEITADKDARLQQTERLPAESATAWKRHQIAADSTCQCERLAAETTPE